MKSIAHVTFYERLFLNLPTCMPSCFDTPEWLTQWESEWVNECENGACMLLVCKIGLFLRPFSSIAALFHVII